MSTFSDGPKKPRRSLFYNVELLFPYPPYYYRTPSFFSILCFFALFVMFLHATSNPHAALAEEIEQARIQDRKASLERRVVFISQRLAEMRTYELQLEVRK